MKKFLFLLLMFFVLISCATKTKVEYVDREVVRNNIIKVHDTISVEKRDSVFHSVIQKGDTVYDTKYIERTRWKDRIVEVYDTCHSDSIVTEYKETVKVEARIPFFYKVAFGIALMAIIITVIRMCLWQRIR